MPAGQSKIGIYNIALGEIGEDPVSSIDEPVKGAIWCSARYDDVRLATLSDAPWTCAKAFAQLAASPDKPLFQWSSQYPLPADFVRMTRIYDRTAKWEVAGDMLMTDQSPGALNVVYGRDVTDPTKYDASLAQCIGLALAVAIAPPFRVDRARIADIQAKYDKTKADAMFNDSQNNSPREFGQDVLLVSRV